MKIKNLSIKTIKYIMDKALKTIEEIISVIKAKEIKLKDSKHLIDEALEIARKIDDEYYRSLALSNIASALAKAGEPNKAVEIARGAIEIARKIKDKYYCSQALSNIASALAKAGEPYRHIFDEALEIARKIDDEYYRSLALSNIASALAKAGEPNKAVEIARGAIEIARKIKDKYYCSQALSNIASALAKAGEPYRHIFDEALEIARKIKDKYYRSLALSNIASALAKAGEPNKAVEIARGAIEIARKIKDKYYCSQALSNIASALAKAGEPYRHIFDEALEIARKIDDEYYRSLALSNIASALAKAGEPYRHIFDEALEIARKIKYTSWYSTALSNIASALAEAEEIDVNADVSKVNNLLNSFKEAFPELEKYGYDIADIENSLDNVRKYLENKDYKKAEETLRQIKENLMEKKKEYDELVARWNDILSRASKAGIKIEEKIPEEFDELKKELNKIEKKLSSIKPDIKLEIKGDFVKDEWRKAEIIVKNKGKIKAENIRLEYISDVAEVKGKSEIKEIEKGEEKIMEIRIKSKDAGYIPLDIKITYEHPLTGREESRVLHPEIYVRKEAVATPTPSPIHATRIKSRIKELYKETQEISYPYGDFFSYEIVDKIGSGGFCNVYLVRKKGNNEEYAMKIPKGIDMSGGETLFLQEKDLKTYGKEANIWAMLTEKLPDDVINLIDAGIQPFPWFVMELADESLRQKMKKMDEEEKISLIIELLRKLDKVHHFGVVHRDLKPENILFVEDKAKLTDFGLAKIVTKSSRSGVSSGTPDYMAPEQISKKKFGDIDWRTDIWQMGVIAYELLAGETPFKGEGYEEIGMAILFEEPLPLTEFGYDKEISNAIMKALQKKKEERYQSALEFMNELRRIR